MEKLRKALVPIAIGLGESITTDIDKRVRRQIFLGDIKKIMNSLWKHQL